MLETEQKEWTLESYALVVTYKGESTGDVPVKGLIKAWGLSKHIKLKRGNNVKHDRFRALVPSKATHHWWIDSASKLETEQHERTFETYALVVTYKVGTAGDIPGKGLIKAWGLPKTKILRRGNNVKHDWLRAFVSSKATHQWWVDSASRLET
jgi:hypothetical protein